MSLITMARRSGVFQSTMQPMDLSIRGIGRTRQSPQDLRHTARFAGGAADEEGLDLRRATIRAGKHAKDHIRAKSSPIMRKSIRQETNLSILDYEKSQKTLVLSLRQVETVGKQELHKLHRINDRAKRLMEDLLRRTVWMVKECQSKRARHPHVRDDDVARALQEEQQLAKQWLTVMERTFSANTRLLQQAHSGLKDIATEIARERKPLKLNTESYAGTVQGYPLPRGDPPPVAAIVQELVNECRAAQQETEGLMADAATSLKQQRQAVDELLKKSSEAKTQVEGNLHMARGEARLGQHATARHAFTTYIADEVNEGPSSTMWQTVAERKSRPRVSVYNTGVGNAHGAVSAWEASHHSHKHMQQSTKLFTEDHHRLKKHAHKLDAAVADQRAAARIDDEVLRFRRRCGPGKRVLTRP
eukprot:m.84698 g.84698  ORF g.84698 m.84698 type:complete len:417 (+) comp12759_c0_seq2:133-1383(+)